MKKISFIALLIALTAMSAHAMDVTVNEGESFTTAVNNVNNGTDADNTVTISGTVTGGGSPKKSMNIIGTNNATAAGLSFTGGMGFITSVSDVTFLGIINNGDGFSPQTGHTLTLTNVTMDGVSTSGAIRNDGKLTIIGGSYANNQGANTNGGGAIMNITTETTYISGGARFVNNSAGGGGGAIQNQSTGAMDISDSFFIDNSTTMYGGAIRWSGNGTIKNTIFENNSANIGGALYGTSASAVLNVIGGEFNGNHSTVDDNAATGYGGAIRFAGTLNITDTIFDGNYAQSGGAIDAEGQTSITGGEFKNNISLGYGGGAIDFSGGTYGMIITGTKFTDNKATSANGGNGGALNLAGTVIITGNAEFTGNTATGNGGAIGVYNNNNITIDGATFTDNTADGYGGAIAGSTMTIRNAEFTGNEALGTDYGGGAVYMGGTGRIIDNVIFNDNHADSSWGGALFLSSANNAVLNNVSFDGNTAVYGGAIFTYSLPTNAITISGNSSFTNNYATAGGAIFNMGIINLDSSTGNIIFRDNTDDSGGADIYNNDEPDPADWAAVNIIGDSNIVSMNGGIGGLGYVNKTGANLLILENENDSSAFGGVFRQSAGRTLVYSTKFFGGENYITDGSRLSILNSDTSIGTLHLETGGSVGLRETYGNISYNGTEMVTSGEYKPNVLVVDTLTSDGTGMILMESDGTTSDMLRITGSATGDFFLHIDPIGNNPTMTKIKVVDFTDADIDHAVFKLDPTSGIFKIGAYEYDLVMEDDAGHDNWYLELNGNLNASAQTAAGIPALHLSIVKSGMNELRKRMGELRQNNNNDDLVGAWIRGYGKHLQVTDIADTKMNLFGIEGGFDIMGNMLNGKVYAGLMAGMLDSEDIKVTTNRGAEASGWTRTPSVGAYLTWIHKSGNSHKWFVDLTARHFWVHDNIDRNDHANGYNVTRRFWAFSGEVGKLFYMESPEWLNIGTTEHSHISIEPKAELRYGRGQAMGFTMDNGTHGYVDTTNAFSTRLYVQTNFLPNGVESTWKSFLELGIYNEWSGETDMLFAGESIKASDTSGIGFEATLGTNATISDRTYAYGGLTAEIGKVYKSYQLSLGIRTKF